MTGSRAALDTARSAAELARREPTEANRKAVMVALATVVRHDAAGAAAGGKGYNPYRDKGGKFAPGAHKARPTAGEKHAAALAKAQERVGKAKATVDKHTGKLTAAHQAKQSALAEMRAALDKARGAAEVARAKPTAKNIKAAQVATNKATRAAAKVGKHEAAIDKATANHAKATSAHAKAVEAHEQLKSGGGRSGARTASRRPPEKIPGEHTRTPEQARRDAVANGFQHGSDGKGEFTPAAQAAARDEARHVLEARGVTQREPHAAGKNALTVEELGGSYAMFYPETHRVAMSPESARLFADAHREIPTEIGRRARAGDAQASEMIQAQHNLIHETFHGSGPDTHYEGHGVFAEEMVTEMAARSVTADMHGVSQEFLALRNGAGYDWVLTPAVSHLATASGRTFGEAHRALADASLEFKRQRHVAGSIVHGENVIHAVTKDALGRLGQRDPAVHKATFDKFISLSGDM